MNTLLSRRELFLGSRKPAEALPDPIEHAPPRASARRKLVHIDAARCFPFCSVCQERCPVPGAIVQQGRSYRIDEGTCTGCGVCLEFCPSAGAALRAVR